MRVLSNSLFCLVVLVLFPTVASQWSWNKKENTTVAPPTTTTTIPSSTRTSTTKPTPPPPPTTMKSPEVEPATTTLATSEDDFDTAGAGDSNTTSELPQLPLRANPVPDNSQLGNTSSPDTTNGTDKSSRDARGFIDGFPINGGWSNWAQSGPCNVNCGVGWAHFERFCNNPEPENGGNGCIGSDSRKIDACLMRCEIPGLGNHPVFGSMQFMPMQPGMPPGMPPGMQPGMPPGMLPQPHMLYGWPQGYSPQYMPPPGSQSPPSTMGDPSTGSTQYNVNNMLPPVNVVPIPQPVYTPRTPPLFALPAPPPPRPNLTPPQITPGSMVAWSSAPASREPQVTPSYWTEWSQWSPCARTCDLGESMRKRTCQWNQGTTYCAGSAWQTKYCYLRSCPTAPKVENIPIQAQPPAARPWSGAWSGPVRYG